MEKRGGISGERQDTTSIVVDKANILVVVCKHHHFHPKLSDYAYGSKCAFTVPALREVYEAIRTFLEVFEGTPGPSTIDIETITRP